jgi:exopolysaccharide biosynthesis polyprenyl glycosylphosphotransferase
MTPPPAVTESIAARLGSFPHEPFDGLLKHSSIGPRWWLRVRFLLDAFVLVGAAMAAALGQKPSRLTTGESVLAIAYPLVVALLLYARRSPEDRLSQSSLDVFSHVLGVTSLAAMLTVAANSGLRSPHPLTLPLRLWIFSLFYLGVARLVLRVVRRHALAHASFAAPTLIVGAGIVGQQLASRLIAEPAYGLRPVGLIDSDPLPRSGQFAASTVPILGGARDLVDAAVASGCRQVVVAFSSAPDHLIVDGIERCRRLGISILLVPRMFELFNERATLDHVGNVPVISLRPTDPSGWEFAVKHALDRIVAAVALLVLSPALAVIALVVRLTSPGPILFRQLRVGRDGREFLVLKFRTMHDSPPVEAGFDLAEGLAPGGVEGIDRRTPFGAVLRKSSLDELPQLINVLRGEMSLVGPRPERPEYVERFTAEVDRYDRRHRVKSGITGLAQVRGLRGQTSIAERVEWDNFYIQNWSIWLDLRILLLTVAEVLRFRDSWKDRHRPLS